jgi:hypothetical protein
MTIHDNGYFYTGTRATDDEENHMKLAFSVPLIVVGGSIPPSPGEIVHSVALRHGLPEIRGYYGYDFREHEFVREADADQGPVDSWPSRRLEDILQQAGI